MCDVREEGPGAWKDEVSGTALLKCSSIKPSGRYKIKMTNEFQLAHLHLNANFT